jgi:hypothetical protein
MYQESVLSLLPWRLTTRRRSGLITGDIINDPWNFGAETCLAKPYCLDMLGRYTINSRHPDEHCFIERPTTDKSVEAEFQW